MTTITPSCPVSGEVERPYGDAGDALDWGLDHMPKRDDLRGFLEAWREGNLRDYADYLRWVKIQHEGADRAKALRVEPPSTDYCGIVEVDPDDFRVEPPSDVALLRDRLLEALGAFLWAAGELPKTSLARKHFEHAETMAREAVISALGNEGVSDGQP
jgi:hypothetical protein